jgi:hypothetical protein
MVSQNNFRKMALALAGAEESPHFDKASFRIGKKNIRHPVGKKKAAQC